MKSKNISQVFILLLFILAIYFFNYFQLSQYLNLESLKTQKANLDLFYQANTFTTILLYFIGYVAVTALSLPGAGILTLAGGALFGLGAGTLIVSFASTIGATLAFLSSRYLLRDFFKEKFGAQLAPINQGLAKEGALYLFTLRLIPAFPFFLVNAVMGLTNFPVLKYYLVSQVGMLAGTLVFVNAGTELGQLESLSGILTPQIWLSFVAIGILPLLSKSVLGFFKARRYLKNYKRPKGFDYNTLVIGAGSAGLVSAYISAAVKAKVGLIEKHKMGGDCLNTGCVPSKAILRSAKVFHLIHRAQEFGITVEKSELHFQKVMQRVHKVIAEIEPHDSVQRYSGLGVECISGNAELLSPYEVRVNGKTLAARNIILATGAGPLVPKIPGLQEIPYLTSDTVWNLKSLPQRLLVLGGGAIGCELAQAFSYLGSSVTMVEKSTKLLSKEEPEVSELLQKNFLKQGIQLKLGHEAVRFHSEGGKNFLEAKSATGSLQIEFDAVLLALGRKPNTQGFGAEKLGLDLNANGTFAVDEFLRTTKYPNIYACGDVAGPYQFTHVAAHQAWYAAVNSLFSPFKKFKADYRVIPWCTFTSPEVARVGFSEAEAKAQNMDYEVTHYGIDDLDRAIADSEAEGFVKVLTAKGSDKILGVTIVGERAGDILAEFVLAMKYHLGLSKILGTIHLYPSYAEANKYVAGRWRQNHKPDWAMSLLEKFHASRL